MPRNIVDPVGTSLPAPVDHFLEQNLTPQTQGTKVGHRAESHRSNFLDSKTVVEAIEQDALDTQSAARVAAKHTEFSKAAQNAIHTHMPEHAQPHGAVAALLADHDDDHDPSEMHIHVRYIDDAGFGVDGLGGTTDPDLATQGTASAPSLLGDMADYLSSGYWTRNGSTIENRFHNVSTTGNDPNNGVLLYNVSGYVDDPDGLTAPRAFLVQEAFKLFGATLGIDFQQTTSTDTSVVDFLFSDDESGAYAGSSIYGNGEIGYSYLNIDVTWSGGSSTYDDYTFQTILHEIGHALGLGHQGPYNGSATYGVDNQFENDSWQASMMSYFSQTQNTSVTGNYEFLQTPMTVDWMALNDLYGTQGFGTFNAFTENTVWGFNTTVTSDVSDVWANFSSYGNRTASTLVDGGGIDTLDLSGYGNNTLINLAPSDRASTAPSLSNIGGSVGNFAIAEGTIIENAIGGAGSEVFFGNVADNILTGNGGDDTFVDSAGADTYLGGAGTDTVLFGQALSNFGFAVVGSFLQVIDVVVDLVDITVEWLDFAGEVYSWTQIADGIVPNALPVASDDTNTVAEDDSTTGNVLTNDSDPDGDLLSVIAVNGQSTSVGSQIALASGALVTLNADGSYAYVTNGAFDALNDGETAQDSFTYRVSDGFGGTDTATVAITINGKTVLVAPVAANDTVSLSENETASGNVLANDTDANGDQLSVVALNGDGGLIGTQITLGSGALLTLNANGTYNYDPNGVFDTLQDGETGSDSFSYTVSDGNGGTDTATVTITIAGVSPAPIQTPVLIDFETAPLGDFAGIDGINATGLSVSAGTVLSGDRLAQSNGFTLTTTGEDFDLNGLTLQSAGGRVRVTIEAWDDGVRVGSQNVNLRANRTNDITFDTTFDSVDEIRAISSGGVLVDDIALVTRSVDGPGGNTGPVALDDSFATKEATIATSNLLANDSDPDGDTVVLSSIEGNSSGTVLLQSGAVVSFAADGTVSYNPNGAFDSLYDGQTAEDSFVYEISDGQGGTSQATATVTISGSGTPPPAPTMVEIGFEGTFVDGVLAEDSFVFNNVEGTNSGTGVSSGSQAAQSIGNSIILTQSGNMNFDLESAVVTAQSGKNVTLFMEAYDDGALIGTDTLRIRDNRETLVNFDDTLFGSVDEVILRANGGLIIDDALIFA